MGCLLLHLALCLLAAAEGITFLHISTCTSVNMFAKGQSERGETAHLVLQVHFTYQDWKVQVELHLGQH